ncbi:MAG: hypothetical protein A2104_00420 [Candidatus Melainabacteria bacterium GWF2_32_7]|nr:MAG: hypothetical protein A2104_00420 [Candidatus Melainabacteria bacterium GWF2_32_7]
MPEFYPPEPESDKKYPFGTKAILSVFKETKFPITRQEILQNYGNKEVEYKTGETMKVSEIFGDTKVDKFNSPDDLVQVFHEKLSQQ